MKFWIISTLILYTVTFSIAAEGPCSRKLLSTHDQTEDSTYFISYLESLLTDRTLSNEDIAPFVKSLHAGKLTNPIPNRLENKHWAFHHDEFESLIASDLISVAPIQVWVDAYIARTSATEKNKASTKKVTEVLPAYIGPDGSMFYLYEHPTLGPSYKILKPGGKFAHPEDWEELVWPVHAITDHQGLRPNFSMKRAFDEDHTTLVSQNAEARKICIDQGEGIDLPSIEEMNHLLSHFDYKVIGAKDDPKIQLQDPAIKEFQKLFPDAPQEIFWLASPCCSKAENKSQVWYFSGQGCFTDHVYSSQNSFAVRCRGKLRQ